MLKLLDVYNKLRAYHGSQGWWPAETAFEVLVGAVLTQRTTWRNAAKGIENLRRKGLLEPTNLALTEEDEITECIRCTGFYRQKAERLLGIARIITWRYRGSLESMFEGATTEELRELLIRRKPTHLPHRSVHHPPHEKARSRKRRPPRAPSFIHVPAAR
jgi:endonuclease-3 related protein